MSKVYFIGAGPGDPDLITLKGKRLLDEADLVIYTGSLINPLLLTSLKASLCDSKDMTLEAIIRLIIKATNEGKKVVRLHTGDTSFYSAINEQIAYLRKEGIDYEVIPGVSSALAGSAVLGIELTIPELCQTVIFTRLEGKTTVPEKERLRELAKHNCTMVIFLSISMIDKVCEELIQGGFNNETPVVVIEKATWKEQRIIKGTINSISSLVKDAGITKTALIYVGDVLKATTEGIQKKSRLYDKDFSHCYRKK
ncbi:MAG TPA: precorrin-4 C(11)-methyltransferase [Nitrospirae bacterium]|nr:precorrin-4 C(11)-methyltransferase [Nitrospirota bacterium]